MRGDPRNRTVPREWRITYGASTTLPRRTASDSGSSESSGTPSLDHALTSRYYVYADGILLDDDGARPEADERQLNPIALPYASTEVVQRLGVYDVLGELGRGGMGYVHKAYARNLARYVAIKFISESEDTSEAELLRFHNEAILAARLKHPNIVTVFDSGAHGDLHYFVMEYIEGHTLRAHVGLKERGPLVEAIRIVLTVARAIDFAHKRGIIHRDIKPENIIIDAEKEPHIVDFGVAKALAGDAAITLRESILGTPDYMPPEQANGEVENIGPHSDIYALGATLYHVLTGVPPFRGSSARTVIYQVLTKEPESPSNVAFTVVGRGVPRDLEIICLKAMAKDAVDRYASAGDLADDLERHLSGESIRARPQTFWERSIIWMRRNRLLVRALVAMALVILGLSLVFTLLTLDNTRRSTRTLIERDLEDAFSQASTIERAIRVVMLQGRADEARLLVKRLSEAPDVARIEVVRLDRRVAYIDSHTKERVAERLAEPKVIENIRSEHPEMLSAVEVVQRTAFQKIDKEASSESVYADLDRDVWRAALQSLETRHYIDRRGNVPTLVVLRPIENSRECQVCHSGDEYTDSRIRAILVMRRSQARLLSTLEEYKRSTLIIAWGAMALFGFLMFLFYRVLGFRLSRHRFGARSTPGAH